MIDVLIWAASLWHRLLVFTGLRVNKHSSHLEVERKFSISQVEAKSLPHKLNAIGFVHSEDVLMTDSFLPAPDGEMKRVREEHVGPERRYILTRKHWVEIGGSKERQEAEFELSAFAKTCLLCLGRWLNGSNLLSFSKSRKVYSGRQQAMDVVVSIDHVDGLGTYSGDYLEVEVLVPIGNDVEPARTLILQLAQQLLAEARQPVKQSYLDMLKASYKEAN